MRWAGLLVAFLGIWAIFYPGAVLNGIYRNFYKKQDASQNKSKLLGLRILALLWVMVGIIIFMKQQ